MQGILWSMIEGSGFLQHDWMQWIFCSMAQSIPIECSGFHAAWRNGTLWMQWILCSMIECSGFHAAWLNAVDFMQHGPKHPDWMQWIPWSIIECRVFHALWRNGSRLYAVESMQWGPMHPDWRKWVLCSMAQIIPIECSGLYAAWLQQCNPLCSSVIHAEC